MAKLSVINGPNLNILGLREPHYYGVETLGDINEALRELAQELGDEIHFFQSNAEHELIEQIHENAHNDTDFMIFNPAAFTHTSIALRDALLAVDIPFIEVHISNIYARDQFRSHSYFSDIAVGSIAGFGTQSYMLALRAAHEYIQQSI